METKTWSEFVHKYGPWLLAVIVAVAMSYIRGNGGNVNLPPIPQSEQTSK